MQRNIKVFVFVKFGNIFELHMEMKHKEKYFFGPIRDKWHTIFEIIQAV